MTLEVYTEALCYETTVAEWDAFTRSAARGRFAWFPKIAELIDALREFRGQPNLDAEAVAAYERVMAAGHYTAEGGTSWSFRAVFDACGKAAAEAFLEAGGHNAFANTFRESERREKFVAAYRTVARQDEAARLLPPPEVRQIAGNVESAPPTREEAHDILERVSGIHSGEEEPRPEPVAAAASAFKGAREALAALKAKAPSPDLNVTDERLEFLRRQAKEIASA